MTTSAIPSFDEAKGRLIPRVFGETQLSILRSEHRSRRGAEWPAVWRIAGELCVAVCLDEGGNWLPVTQEMVDQWRVEPRALWSIAFDNSRDTAKGVAVEEVRPKGSVLRHENRDWAAWLLTTPSLVEKVRVKGSPVLFVPMAEEVYLTGSHDLDGLAFVAQLLEYLVVRGDEDVLTVRPLVLADGAWHAFDWPAPSRSRSRLLAREHPVVSFGPRLERHFWIAWYRRQAAALAGGPARVARVDVSESLDGLPILSASVTEGVETLLPEVDQVVRIDPRGVSTSMPMAQFLADAGDRVHQTDLLPRRYLVYPRQPHTIDDLAAAVLTDRGQRVFREAVAYLRAAGPESFRRRYRDLDDDFADDGPSALSILLKAGQHPYPWTIGWCDWAGEDEVGQVRDFVASGCRNLGLAEPVWDEATEDRVTASLAETARRGDYPPALFRDIDTQLRTVGLRLLMISEDSDMYHFAPVTAETFAALDGVEGEGYVLGGIDRAAGG